MQQLLPQRHAASLRVWYPFPLVDRNARSYRVSFLIAEEATWDHRFHDMDGTEIAAEELAFQPPDYRFIQSSCDHAVGSRALRLVVAANSNAGAPAELADRATSPA
jgi:hypothetical protein